LKIPSIITPYRNVGGFLGENSEFALVAGVSADGGCYRTREQTAACDGALMFLLLRGKLFETHALAGLELYLMCGESLNVG